MPGIGAIIGPSDSSSNLDSVRRMIEVMCHEPFYTSGTLCESSEGIAAGWAVHETAFAAGNPVWNSTRDICLLLTGEEFSQPGEVSALRRSGARLTADDAQYLVRWYEELGPRFVEELNGTFSGLVIDLRAKRTILFNDRFGLGRVYVHETQNRLHIASEAKALLATAASTRRLDEAALAEFATCGCPLQGRSLFQGISLLPPASRWIYSEGRPVARETYFRVDSWEQLPPLSQDDFYARLRETFPRVVRKYFRGAPRVAMSLTGGLDGRMIMTCSGHESGTLPCYTFGGAYRDCADVALARRVAEDCGQPHQVIKVDSDFLSQFGALAERAVYISDGAMDVTGSVELFANSHARRIAPVRMTGNYGSEILRSNIAFRPQALDANLFSADFVRASRVAASSYEHEAQVRRLSLIAMKQVPWHHHARLAIEQSQLTMRSPYLDNELVELAYQAPRGYEFSKEPALRFVGDGRPTLARIPTDRGLLYRPIPVLTRLVNAYQEFTFRAEYAYDYGMPQWLARVDRCLKPLRPERLLLGRHKFYHFRVWYRDRLGPYLKEVLLDPKSLSRPHLLPGRLEALLNEHLAGIRNHTTALHQVLSIELIHRQLTERRWSGQS